jgi:ribose 5-phosphate isomerase B
MRIAVAADHAGFPIKDEIIACLRALGHDVIDLGTDSTAPVDYPDYARAVGESVMSGQAERGIVLCGSGVGACVAANKMPGIRACVCHDTYSGHQGVEHDDMNVLCLGARIIGPELALEVVRAFVGASFSGEERHVRRLNKVLEIEQRYERAKEQIDG